MTSVMLFVEVELELTAPATIAAPERDDNGTGQLRRTAREGWSDEGNAPWVPPSSLAGSLRAHLGQDRGPILMGEEPGDEQEDGEAVRGRPSAVRILGTQIHLLDQQAELQFRHRTAIDRYRAAAATHMLHSTEQLPPGTGLVCHLRVDGGEHHEEVLEVLRTWRPVIGASRTTGQGTTRTRAIRHTTLDLNTREGRRTWLTQGGPGLFTGGQHLEPAPDQAAQPLIAADWQIVDALHIGTGQQRQGEAAELLRDHAGRPVIPGTTWKGLLRSRCSYVLASLDQPVCPDEQCGSCDLCTAFGWSGPSDAQGARGLLRFPDTPLLDTRMVARQHVALDRVFGGAADAQLFTHEVAEAGHTTLHVHADGDIPPAILAALRLALYDLHSGLIGIGGNTTRGYGTLRCTDPNLAEAWRAEGIAHFAPLLEAA